MGQNDQCLFLEMARKHLGWYKWSEARKYFCFSECLPDFFFFHKANFVDLDAMIFP